MTPVDHAAEPLCPSLETLFFVATPHPYYQRRKIAGVCVIFLAAVLLVCCTRRTSFAG